MAGNGGEIEVSAGDTFDTAEEGHDETGASQSGYADGSKTGAVLNGPAHPEVNWLSLSAVREDSVAETTCRNCTLLQNELEECKIRIKRLEDDVEFYEEENRLRRIENQREGRDLELRGEEVPMLPVPLGADSVMDVEMGGVTGEDRGELFQTWEEFRQRNEEMGKKKRRSPLICNLCSSKTKFKFESLYKLKKHYLTCHLSY